MAKVLMILQWASVTGWAVYTACVLADDIFHNYVRHHPPYRDTPNKREFYNLGNYVGVWALVLFVTVVQRALHGQALVVPAVWGVWVWLDQWWLYRIMGEIALWMSVAMAGGLSLALIAILRCKGASRPVREMAPATHAVSHQARTAVPQPHVPVAGRQGRA